VDDRGDESRHCDERGNEPVLFMHAFYGGGFPVRFRPELDSLRPRWDNPTMIVTLDAKRRVSIPVALAPAAPGDQFEATFDAEDDTVILRRLNRKPNWLAVWRQCPVPMDDLPPRRRELPRRLKP
jgi:bifunctional DNA-binding transcriptional regulator/antitoxin component of YhaV-PrlF toxin-antitoxin module